MNKKFSTLVGCLALGALFSANAQTVQDAYRTFATTSVSKTSTGKAGLSALTGGATFNGAAWSQDVYHIQDNLLYQLQVTAGTNIQDDGTDPYVLIQERNYETGKIYLKAVKSSEAPLNASLWTINYDKEDGVSGGKFTYVNKETGFALTFDHERAAKTVGTAPNAKATAAVEMNGCTDNWSWYTVNSNVNPFDYSPVFSYLHNQANNQVMCLVVADDATVTGDLATDGMNKTGVLLTSAVYDSNVAGPSVGNIPTIAVNLKPVVANPIIMTADDLNARMDADFHATNFEFLFNPNTLEGTAPFTGSFVAEKNALGLTLADVDAKKFNLNFKIGNKYLLADTARYQEEKYAPSVSPSVQFAVKTPVSTDGDYMKARYYFKATYFPTNDSLLIEPLNAAVQEDAEFNAHTDWKASKACTQYFENDYTVANTFTNTKTYATTGSNTVSLTAATIPGQTNPVLTVARDNRDEFKVKTSIVRPFEYLTRGTVANGLYFINLYTTKSSVERANGMYIVENMEGNMMYDNQAMDQDFSLMPATQWVVEQLDCNDASSVARRVKIHNREYADQVFEGQLYNMGTTAAGETIYRFIDRTYVGGNDNKGMFNNQNLGVQDSIIFTAVTSPIAKTAYHGYKKFTVDELSNGIENNYTIKYYHFNNDNLYLQSEVGKISKAEEATDPTIYEIAEATLPNNGGAIVNSFGYSLDGYQDLQRTAYVLKLKDANLLDNDKKYLALVKNAQDNNYYYEAVKKADIDGVKAKWAYFYLKADQVRSDANNAVTDTCYVLVDIQNTNGTLETSNGWNKANVVDGLGTLRFSSLNDNPEDRASAFYFQHKIRPQYIDMTADYDMPMNNVVKIYRKSGNANEYLFEDGNDSKNVSASQPIADVQFLGIESKGVSADAAAMYVDKVLSSNKFMPQYLFAVDVDSIPDGFLCGSKTHGYWETEAEAKAADDNHYVAYNGYVAGRFLVNYTDSVQPNNNVMTDADKFKFENYTRLGFVEGVHQVTTDAKGNVTAETLYILNNGKTLADVTTIVNNTETGTKVIDFDLLRANSVANVLDGAHKNYAFSLRKINDQADETADASEGFLMESNGQGSAIGSFAGAWVKVHNGIPVLAQITPTGDHEDISASINEVINQSQVFHFGQTDETPTENEGVKTTEVSVSVIPGAVVVKGAEGKTVAISNVLGQTIANTVITSSEATISVPAGIVFVAVEGESAVKAIIK